MRPILFDVALECNSESHYSFPDTWDMEPRKLLEALMERDGVNANALARRLKNQPSQPQIYKFLTGASKEPRRATLRPIAEHYGVELEAFYDPELADREAKRLSLTTRPSLSAAPPPATTTDVPEEYRSVLGDLDDIAPAKRSRLIDAIRQAAEEAREAAAHHETRKKTHANAAKSRRRVLATLTLGDGNASQSALPLSTVRDPFTAAPGERESRLYKQIEAAPKGPKGGK